MRGNTALAIKWYRRAIEHGETIAAANMATVYRNQDHLRLAQWYLRAMKLDDGDAAVDAGYGYLYGIGTRKDLRTARRLLRIAVRRGFGRYRAPIHPHRPPLLPKPARARGYRARTVNRGPRESTASYFLAFGPCQLWGSLAPATEGSVLAAHNRSVSHRRMRSVPLRRVSRSSASVRISSRSSRWPAQRSEIASMP